MTEKRKDSKESFWAHLAFIGAALLLLSGFEFPDN
jgi:hypothetical protein